MDIKKEGILRLRSRRRTYDIACALPRQQHCCLLRYRRPSAGRILVYAWKHAGLELEGERLRVEQLPVDRAGLEQDGVDK